jgi:voltage-dependent anion channel protein 2
LTQQLILSHPSLKGVKLDFSGSSVPQGQSTLKVGLEAAQGPLTASSYVDLVSGPTATASLSSKVKDFMLGADVAYDVSTGRIDKYTASVALDRPREKVVIQMYGFPFHVYLG